MCGEKCYNLIKKAFCLSFSWNFVGERVGEGGNVLTNQLAEKQTKKKCLWIGEFVLFVELLRCWICGFYRMSVQLEGSWTCLLEKKIGCCMRAHRRTYPAKKLGHVYEWKPRCVRKWCELKWLNHHLTLSLGLILHAVMLTIYGVSPSKCYFEQPVISAKSIPKHGLVADRMSAFFCRKQIN